MEKTLAQREEALDTYDLSFVFEKIETDNLLPVSILSIAEAELKKFFKLVLRVEGPLAMIDKRVDELWHTFILFTPQYKDFCENVMGFFVHHQPRTSFTPVPVGAIKNFIDAYEENYGNLSEFWFETLTPDLANSIKHREHIESLTFKWSGWTGRNFPM